VVVGLDDAVGGAALAGHVAVGRGEYVSRCLFNYSISNVVPFNIQSVSWSWLLAMKSHVFARLWSFQFVSNSPRKFHRFAQRIRSASS
jgi:hypothetical protein